MKHSISYPNLLDRPHITPHSIHYDLDELVGFFEGKLSIGVIPHCFFSCSAIISWYKNGDLHAKELYTLVLFDIPLTEEPSSLWCEIDCKNNPNIVTSKKITLKVGP